MPAWHYEKRAKFSEIEFNDELQQVVIVAIREVCGRKGYELYYAVCVDTQAHALVGWRRESLSGEEVHDTIKRIVGFKLPKHTGVEVRTWLSRGRDLKRVGDGEHFEHLVKVYLPDHHGVTWISERARNV